MARKILIVDDDLFIRELYRDVLVNAGFDTDLAENGEEGLSKLKNGEYDLTLLDMKMSPIDGLNVLRKLSEENEAKTHGKIVLLTNMEMDDEIKEGLEKGASGYLVKADLTPDQLVEEINKFLPSQS
jgi:two-component system, OmpR family, response regulator